MTISGCKRGDDLPSHLCDLVADHLVLCERGAESLAPAAVSDGL
eukprot:COSAG01_NODE_33186_length_568_cov_2.400853_1_plen_43_part_01